MDEAVAPALTGEPHTGGSCSSSLKRGCLILVGRQAYNITKHLLDKSRAEELCNPFSLQEGKQSFLLWGGGGRGKGRGLTF